MSQCLEALEKANSVRSRGALVKQGFVGLTRTDGLLAVASMVEDNYLEAGALRVETLVACVRGYGTAKAAAFPHARKRVRELSVFERMELASALRYAAEAISIACGGRR